MKEQISCQLSVSIGVTILPRKSYTFEVLYKKTDEALYMSKHNGKNQWTFYQGEDSKNEKNL
jgi:GGDEF domain-containing protein